MLLSKYQAVRWLRKEPTQPRPAVSAHSHTFHSHPGGSPSFLTVSLILDTPFPQALPNGHRCLEAFPDYSEPTNHSLFVTSEDERPPALTPS